VQASHAPISRVVDKQEGMSLSYPESSVAAMRTIRGCGCAARAGLVLVFVAAAILSLPGGALAKERPNIVFILTDDVGVGDLRAYNADTKVALPTIDRLASEGIRFTDAHTTAAKCAPSRYSIITGNYHWRGRKNWGQWQYKGGSQILPGQQTLGSLLQRAGYRTAIIGKYHLGAQFYEKNSDELATGNVVDSGVDFSRSMQDGPAEHGFDRSFLALRGIQAGPYAFFSDGRLVGSPNDLIMWQVGDYGDTAIEENGIGLPNWNTSNVGPVLLEQAIDFIENHDSGRPAGAGRAPFFLYLNTQAVHSPTKPPVSIAETPILGSSGLTSRTDMLVEVDAVLDQIIRTLDRRGLLEDTLIIFTSDNGGLRLLQEENRGHLVSGGFRGDKGTIYEGGHRVPLIVKLGSRFRGVSSLAPGSAIDSLVGIHDLYATLAELTGVPMTAGEGLDSLSFLPLLTGQTATGPRRAMVHEANAPDDLDPDGGITGRHFAYRSGPYKLVFDSSGTALELYNLDTDPAESSNLIGRGEHRDRVARMRDEFEAVRSSERTAPLTDGNGQPVVEINEPQNGSAFSFGETIGFRASASDAEDGELDESIVWNSDIDGNLGTGPLLSVSALTVGEHRISASVTDSGGATGSSSITVAIVATTANQLPVVSITMPADGVTLAQGAPVEFSADASDAEDGSLDDVIAWSSNIDGALGTGGTITVSTLSTGSHVISAQVTDSASATRKDSITISVSAQANSPPSVDIESPSDSSSFADGSNVDLRARSSDPEDGSVDDSIEWTSSIDGILGNGASIAVSTLSVGAHTITATAMDSAGATGSDTINVTVSEPTPSTPDDRPSSSSGSGGGSLGMLDLLWLLPTIMLQARRRRATRNNAVATLHH
jgi:arylsulfatase A